MSLTFDILGQAGRDNALLVRIDSGQGVERLLFDCGDGCLDGLAISDVQAIDHLFFSHLHMDHVAGFDHFFRCTFGRDARPNHAMLREARAIFPASRFPAHWGLETGP